MKKLNKKAALPDWVVALIIFLAILVAGAVAVITIVGKVS